MRSEQGPQRHWAARREEEWLTTGWCVWLSSVSSSINKTLVCLHWMELFIYNYLSAPRSRYIYRRQDFIWEAITAAVKFPLSWVEWAACSSVQGKNNKKWPEKETWHVSARTANKGSKYRYYLLSAAGLSDFTANWLQSWNVALSQMTEQNWGFSRESSSEPLTGSWEENESAERLLFSALCSSVKGTASQLVVKFLQK